MPYLYSLIDTSNLNKHISDFSSGSSHYAQRARQRTPHLAIYISEKENHLFIWIAWKVHVFSSISGE